MYRPSRKSAVIVTRLCCAAVIVLVGTWHFIPIFHTYGWTVGLYGAAIFVGLMAVWHEGYATPKRENGESGNALFLILICVALFAALTAAMNSNNRTSTGMLTDQQARLAATEIISYGDSIAQAVRRLQLKGCSEQEIDFSDHQGISKTVDGNPYEYSNPHKRDDGSCGVFHFNGGGITPALLTAGYSDPSVPSGWLHPQSFVVTTMAVKGAGTDSTTGSGTDMLLALGRLQKNVCLQINSILGIEKMSRELTGETGYCLYGGALWDGTFPACSTPFGETETSIVGKNAFCQKMDGTEQYIFYRVLIAR